MTSKCHRSNWKHAVIGACFLMSGGLGIAQEVTPEQLKTAWIEELTPLIPGKFAKIDPVVATFKLSWNNALNAGEMYIAVTKNEPQSNTAAGIFKGVAAGRSTGLARALWPYDFETTADTDVSTLLPLGFSHQDIERKERILYSTGFDRRLNKIVADTTFYTTEDGEEVAAPETKRRVYKFTEAMDILSTVLFVRSLELPDDEVIKAVVFPFNRPYHATLTVLGREKREFKGETFDTIRIEITIGKIEKDLTLKSYEKIRKATMWLTDDEFRLPLELQSEIFVGFVSARSSGFDWINQGETAEAAVERVRKAGLNSAKKKAKTDRIVGPMNRRK